MGFDPREHASPRLPPPTLSGRARTALSQHQRQVAVRERDLQRADRILAGALCACDGASQQEMLGSYLEAVQELRVSLQRLEGFLLHRLTEPPEPGELPVTHGTWPDTVEGP